MEERLQKLLAQAGYGSRRACEEFITAGRVRVNGRVATLGQKADPAIDKITLDGKPLPKAETLTYIALYKPRHVLSVIEGPDPRPTVRELIPLEGQVCTNSFIMNRCEEFFKLIYYYHQFDGGIVGQAAVDGSQQATLILAQLINQMGGRVDRDP